MRKQPVRKKPWYRRALPKPGRGYAHTPPPPPENATPPGVSSPFLQWFGFLGGAVAWLLQFGIAYALFEVACNSNRLAFRVLGLPAVEFLSLLLTLLAAFTALSAAIIAYSSQPAGIYGERVEQPGAHETRGRSRFMAYTGMIMSSFFVLVILANGLQYFFLRTCL